MIPVRTKQLKLQGSPTYEYVSIIIAAGTTQWFSVDELFPESRTYAPLDSLEVINNSAQPLSVFINSQGNLMRVPAYMIKPFTKIALRQFGIRNDGLVDTVAGDIILHMRRNPPDVQIVQSANLMR
jgi:hypothetical protein